MILLPEIVASILATFALFCVVVAMLVKGEIFFCPYDDGMINSVKKARFKRTDFMISKGFELFKWPTEILDV